MSSETTLYSALSSAGTVTAIVSDRIYPDEVPQEKSLPCIAFARTETEHVTTIHSDTPICSRATVEIECMSATRETADALLEIVIPVVAAAKFVPVDRRAALDSETRTYSSILVVDHWQ